MDEKTKSRIIAWLFRLLAQVEEEKIITANRSDSGKKTVITIEWE